MRCCALRGQLYEEEKREEETEWFDKKKVEGGGTVRRMKTKMRAEKEDRIEWGGRLCDKEGQ